MDWGPNGNAFYIFGVRVNNFVLNFIVLTALKPPSSTMYCIFAENSRLSTLRGYGTDFSISTIVVILLLIYDAASFIVCQTMNRFCCRIQQFGETESKVHKIFTSKN